MKCVNINLWNILGCFHYILNAPRKPKRAHSMLLKYSPLLEAQSFSRCIHFLKASWYADFGIVIRY